MPSGWQPLSEPFLSGVELGLFVVFAVVSLLAVASIVRRLLGT